MYVARVSLLSTASGQPLAGSYNATMLRNQLLDFELKWQKQARAWNEPAGDAADLEKGLAQVIQ